MVAGKALSLTHEQRKDFIDQGHDHLSVREQSNLLGLNRSTFYYKQTTQNETEDLELMVKIDLVFEKHPYYGTRRMRAHLR